MKKIMGGSPPKYCNDPPKPKRRSTTQNPTPFPFPLNSAHRPPISISQLSTHYDTSILTATMADNEDDHDLVDYDEEEEEQNVAAEESADAEGKETKK